MVLSLKLLGSLRWMLTVLGYMMLRLLVVALPPLAGILLLLVSEEMLHLLRLSTVRDDGAVELKRRDLARAYKVNGSRRKNTLVGAWWWRGEISGVVSLFWQRSREVVAKHPTVRASWRAGAQAFPRRSTLHPHQVNILQPCGN
jgi:hypothetical protein